MSLLSIVLLASVFTLAITCSLSGFNRGKGDDREAQR